MTTIDTLTLQIIEEIVRQKEESKKHPLIIARTELLNTIKSSVVNLRSELKVHIGDSLNDKYIELRK